MRLILFSLTYLVLFEVTTGSSNSDESTMDIGFLIENPGNDRPKGEELNESGKDVFVKSRDFVMDVVKYFNVSVTGNHVGIVTYGQHPYMAFDFNEHLSNDGVRKAIAGLHRPHRGSNTANAMLFSKNQLFGGSARPESRKFLIILASKGSKDNSPKIADQLKKSGVTIYTIAIDSIHGLVEFNDVVSEPVDTHKFLATSKHLGNLATKLKDLIIKEILPMPSDADSETDIPIMPSDKLPKENKENLTSSEGQMRILNKPVKEPATQENPESPTYKTSKESASKRPISKPFKETYTDNRAVKSLKELSPNDPISELSKEQIPSSLTFQPSKEITPDIRVQKVFVKPSVDNPTIESFKEPTPESLAPVSKEPEFENPLSESVKETAADNHAREASKQSYLVSPASEPPNEPSSNSSNSKPYKESTIGNSKFEPANIPISETPTLEATKKKAGSGAIEYLTTETLPSKLTKESASESSRIPEHSKESTSVDPESNPSPENSSGKAPQELFLESSTTETPKESKDQVPGATVKAEIHSKEKNIFTKDEKGKKQKLLQILTKSKQVIEEMPPPAQAGSYENPSKRVFMPRVGNASLEGSEGVTKTEKDDIEYQLQKKLFGIHNEEIEEHKENSDSMENSMQNEDSEDVKSTQPASHVIGKKCKARVDIAFLLDGSYQVGEENFQNSVTFARKLIKSFTVSNTETHIAVVICSERPHVLFDLRAFNDYKGIKRAMSSITYPKGKMFTGGCLKTIRSGIFVNSGRHDVPKILYFISGSKSLDNVSLPSRTLRDLGVQIFSLGIGNKYSGRELKAVSTAPYSDHVLATRYEILELLRPFVTAQLCRGSGGKLVISTKKATKHLNLSKSSSSMYNKKGKSSQVKGKVPKADKVSSFNKEIGEGMAKRRAALKADIKQKLHILLSKFGKKQQSNAVYRSVIYDINGRKDEKCRDYHKLCKIWNKEGMCQKSSKNGIDSIQRVCPKTCLIC